MVAGSETGCGSSCGGSRGGSDVGAQPQREAGAGAGSGVEVAQAQDACEKSVAAGLGSGRHALGEARVDQAHRVHRSS